MLLVLRGKKHAQEGILCYGEFVYSQQGQKYSNSVPGKSRITFKFTAAFTAGLQQIES